MQTSSKVFVLACLFSLSTQAFETTKMLKKDFQELKTQVIPEKKAKAKKKLSEVSNNLNSKLQNKLKK